MTKIERVKAEWDHCIASVCRAWKEHCAPDTMLFSLVRRKFECVYFFASRYKRRSIFRKLCKTIEQLYALAQDASVAKRPHHLFLDLRFVILSYQGTHSKLLRHSYDTIQPMRTESYR